MRAVLEGETSGDPMSSVKWSRKSTRAVGRAIGVSHTKARHLMRSQNYRLRCNRKRLARRTSPDRNRQFANIKRLQRTFVQRGQAVISVDAKKRELVGNFKNAGRTWRAEPVDVDMYDFPSDANGVAIPYGVYDVTRGDGFVVVGTSHNTPAFATNAIDQWWHREGRLLHSGNRELLILADSGSSNSARSHDWKAGLQQFANKTAMRITVAHYPAGASKWNPVEHRLFGPISTNWAGEPLINYQTICQYIRRTRTTSGSCCKVFLDRRKWQTQKQRKAAGLVIRPRVLPIAIRYAKCLPALNYTIRPQKRDSGEQVI